MKVTVSYDLGNDNSFDYEADANVMEYLLETYSSLKEAIDDLADDEDKKDIDTWEDLEEYCTDHDLLDDSDSFHDWCHDYYEDEAFDWYRDNSDSPDGFSSDYDFHRWVNR